MNNNVKIVVLQRGWVLVGKFSQDGTQCKLTNASVIRRWGTEHGLGQLHDGPTKNTILDKCNGEVKFHELTVVFTLDVATANWIDYLG